MACAGPAKRVCLKKFRNLVLCILYSISLQPFLSEGNISDFPTVRGSDTSHNVIASGYVAFYQINKLFINILFSHYCQNVFAAESNSFAGRIWPAGRSLEIPVLQQSCLNWVYGARTYVPDHLLGHTTAKWCTKDAGEACVIWIGVLGHLMLFLVIFKNLHVFLKLHQLFLHVKSHSRHSLLQGTPTHLFFVLFIILHILRYLVLYTYSMVKITAGFSR